MMRFERLAAFILTLSVMALSICQAPAQAEAKRRIAVLPFEFGAVSSHVGTYDLGKGVTELMINRLVSDGTYRVVDRQMLDSILKEQNLSVSDRADPNTAIKIGKILACDAVVTGTITKFGFESKSVNVGSAASIASGYIPYVGGLGALGGLSTRKSKVNVAITARIIDTATTEIIGTAEGTGMSSKGGTSLGLVDVSDSDFASSIAGEATYQAITQLAATINSLSTRIPDNQSIANKDVQGKIADVTGNQCILNVGKINGLAAGDSLQVERVIKTVKDPVSGKVLKEITGTIAVVKLTQVESDNSTAEIVKSTGTVAVGDNVKKVTADVSAIVLTPLNSSSTATPAKSGSPAGSGATKKSR
jgi:curli biogenesis system outer membrane secretion channel CsgG